MKNGSSSSGLLEIKKIFLMSVWQEELQEAKVIEACQTDP
jgi:hypothetical protein